MNFVYAKSKDNKLEIKDNRLFAIEKIELKEKGFVVYLVDLSIGRVTDVYYRDRRAFDEEWELERFEDKGSI